MTLVAGGMAMAMLSACHRSNDRNTGMEEQTSVAQVNSENIQPEQPDNQVDIRRPDVKIHVKRGQTLAMQTEGLTLTAVDAAVQHEADYSITSLVSEDLPPLPQGMMNMTAATAGYRLLPGGEHFLPYAELRMTYDPERIPEGYSPEDIYTSFYDTATLAWVRLERVEVDTLHHEIVSLTTHFTDFINELLKSPEMPETQAFVPTAMTDLEAVSPMDGLTTIQPPAANNNGTANVSYPLLIPAGRAGMQPNLALNYSSGGGSGWLGVGWDIPVPSITLDTRWGVPRYNAAKETEIYLLDGEQLITKEADGTPRPMPHRTNQQADRLPDGTQFYTRTGDAHDSIIRHGDNPKNYWWEVVDRNGVTHYYGRYRYYPTPNPYYRDPNSIIFPPYEGGSLSDGNTIQEAQVQTTQGLQFTQGIDIHDSRVPDSVMERFREIDPSFFTEPYYDARAGLPATLCDDNGNIARWVLTESRDLYGNTVRYYYDHATVKNHGAMGRQLYLDSISYTGYNENDGYYTVVFCRNANPTTDIPVSCNNGFKEITDQVLNNIYVKYGDSILTAWLFDMENEYKTNYKNRLVSVAKIDSAANGMRNFLAARCHCIAPDEDNDSVMLYILDSTEIKDTITGDGTIFVYDTTWYPMLLIPEIDEGYAGSTYHFSYYDAPSPDNMFGPEVVSDISASNANLHGYLMSDSQGVTFASQATGLGLSQSSSWNVGGTASGGFGPVVCLTSLSLGGNYTRSGSASESLMTLVDLDGDGLADKVYVKDGQMYFCRHKHKGNGEIEFEDPVVVSGASHFLQESSSSKTLGGQFAVGFSGSASWTKTESTTSTYFADVNGDGLIDLVDNGQVLFNSLDGSGYPEFTLYKASQHLAGDDETEATPVVTSASNCGGIIFDGEVNDSITCERIWVSDTSFRCDTTTALNYYNFYLPVPDTMVRIEPAEKEEPNLVEVKRYHLEWDCDYHDDSPNTDAVRVWIAPRNGDIRLTSKVGLKEDTSATRRAARHADGIVYTFQHSSGVTVDGNHLYSTSNDILRTFNICDTCYYDENDPEYLYTYDSTFYVLQGDMLFFRLRSKVSHQFDDVYDHHIIQYIYGAEEEYDSQKDFVLSADYCFQAPVDGYYFIEGDYTDNDGGFELDIMADGSALYPYSGFGTRALVEEGTIHKDSTICFTVRSSNGTSQWGQVKCRPYVIFVPNSTQYRYDTNTFVSPQTVDSSRYTDTIKGWIPCHYDIVHEGNDTIYDRTLLRRLFGPLYNGWGQFAYHSLDTGALADYINVNKLEPTDMLVAGVSNPSDTNGLRSQLRSGDDLDSNAMSSDTSYDSFQEHHNGLYNPLSYSSYWVEMTPDVEHQVWVSYGRQNYVGRDSISNSLQEQWYSSSATVAATTDIVLPETTTFDDPVPAPSANGTPAKAVRKVNRSKTQSWSIGAAGTGVSGSKGTNTIKMDYMDLNGDRYPDNVGLDRVQYSQQWGGLGMMRDLPTDFADNNNSTTTSNGISYSASPITQERIICGSQGDALFTLNSENGGSLSGSGSIGRDRTSGSWMDINGDGLADFIMVGGNAYLNTGYGFVNDGNWGCETIRSGVSGSVSVGGSLPDAFHNVWQGSIQAGASVSGSYNQTERMLMDMNGDGLPDLVTRNLPDSIGEIIDFIGGSSIVTTVAFNKGNGRWSSPEPLNISRFHASTNFSESLNAGLTYGFTLWGIFKVTVGVDGSPYSGSVNRDYIQLVDVDADGLPDLVSSDNENELKVRYNQGGRTNLLRGVTNFNNADFQIEYALSEASYEQPSRSWLMTKVTTHDSLNSHNGATTTVTEYSYANPHYDRYERTSYGYGTVTTSQIDPATGLAYRKIDRDYYNNNMLRRGKLKRELTYVDSNELYIEKTHECSYIDYAHGVALNADTLCPVIAYPVEEATFIKYYEGGTTPLLVVGERTEYDRYHNVVRYTDLGDTSDTGDGLVVEFNYFSGLANNLIGLRRNYTVMPTGSTTAIRSARFEYDFVHGKMTRQVLYNGSDNSVYDFVFEPTYGNLDTAMQPENNNGERMTYHYTFDSVVHTYPTKIVNSYGETMNTTYDYRYGKPLTVTDPSNNTMTYRYDFAGRLVSVNSPLNTSGIPSLVNQYHPRNYYHNGLNPHGYTFSASPSKHPYTVSKHYDDDGGLITETAVLTNGFGQVIQTKKGLRVGNTDKMQVSGRAVVDAFGRTIEQYDPVAESNSTHRGKYNTSYNVNSLSSTTYDILDRTKDVAMPLGVTTHTDYSIDNDWSGHRRFYTKVTDPNGHVTQQYADYDGRQVQVTSDSNGIDATTLMHYDNLGQHLWTRDPEGFTTYYGYDNLGRLEYRDHPDAGTTRYRYDPAGNLVEENNPLGQIYYDYTYYRPVHKRYSYMTGNDVTYEYGTSGNDRGRLWRITDGSGSYECHYDALGNVMDETRTIALPQHGAVYQFKMHYDYDSWGRMLTMTYPDSERIKYEYQWGGDLYAMYGDKNGDSRTYIKGICYNAYGQKVDVDYGNGTSAHYTYDALHRLVNLKSRDYSGTLMQNINYTFDNASNVTNIVNSAGVVNTLGGGYKNSYQYDALHRLVGSNGGGAIGNYRTDFKYSPSGRLLWKYRENHSVTLSDTVDMYYGYCNEYQPHAVKRMFDHENGLLYDMRWDEAGNLGQVSMGKPGEMFEWGRFLFWTEDNRMHAAVDEKYFSYYVYDHSGERRLKLTGINKQQDVNADLMATYTELNEPTLYPSAYMVLSNKGYTKHYYAGTERVAARLGGGGLDAQQHVIAIDEELQSRADKLFKQSLEQVNYRVLDENKLECIMNNEFAKEEFGKRIDGIPYKVRAEVSVDNGQFKDMIHSMLDDPNNGKEKEVYFYHSDHLGSASWITDYRGKAVQHIQYLPYGEPYINQRAAGTTYSERFRFTGKERDEETGFGYFGARYMDHELMTMWLSVDPMADKYPNISPYAYCAWNPVRLVDPDGRDVWSLSDDGTMTWERSSSYDIIKYDKKEISLKNSNNVFGTGSEGYSFSLKDNQYYTFSDVMDAQKAFEFFADNLDFEFSALGYKEDGKTKYDLSTSLSDRGDVNGSKRADELGDKLRKHFHNHPDGDITPSDPENRKGNGDDKTFFDHISPKAKLCKFYLYTKDSEGNYMQYSFENGIKTVIPYRKSSFNKDSKDYGRKQESIYHAFSIF